MPKDDKELGDLGGGLFAIGPDDQPLDLGEALAGALGGPGVGMDEAPEEGELIHGDHSKLLDEGTEISITAMISPSRPEKLTIYGTVVGITVLPGMHPLAPEMPAYIIKVSNPDDIPEDDDGERYRWSCMTFPVDMVETVEKDEETTETTETTEA